MEICLRNLLFIVFLAIFAIPTGFAFEAIGYSGRLTDNTTGAPITGPVDLRIDLYYSGTPGITRCNQTFGAVPLVNGIFNLKIEFDAAGTCSDPGTADYPDAIANLPGGESLVFRVTRTDVIPNVVFADQSILSVPLAYNAQQAQELLGDIDPNTQLRVGDITPANDGDVLKWNAGSSQWLPAVDSGGTSSVDDVIAGNGLARTAGPGPAVVYTLDVNVDDSGIEINSDTLRLKDDGVVTSKILNANVTAPKINFEADHFDDVANVFSLDFDPAGNINSTAAGIRTTNTTNSGVIANVLVKTDGNARLPAIDGRNVTSINAAQVIGTVGGTLPDSAFPNTNASGAGTYTEVTVDAKGRITSATMMDATDLGNIANVPASIIDIGVLDRDRTEEVEDLRTTCAVGEAVVGAAGGNLQCAAAGSSGYFTLHGNAVDIFYIAGSVGLGSNDPDAQLDVEGNALIGNFDAGNYVEIDTNSVNFGQAAAGDVSIESQADGSSLKIGTTTAGSSYATHLTIDSDGNVGIGDETPDAHFHVKRTRTDTGAGSSALVENQLNVSPTGNSTHTFIGNNNIVNTVGAGANDLDTIYVNRNLLTNANTGTNSASIGSITDVNNTSTGDVVALYGTYSGVDNQSTGQVTNLRGSHVLATSTGDGALSNFEGTKLIVDSDSNANITRMIGANAVLRNDGGSSVTESTGVRSFFRNAGTGTVDDAYGYTYELETSGGIVTSAYGVDVDIQNGAGTLTNAFGARINVAADTNAYGVFIGDISGATTKGIYQEGADDPNFFAGNVGIKTQPTANALEVVGTIKATAFQVDGGTPVDFTSGGTSTETASTFNTDNDSSGDGGFNFQVDGKDELTITNDGTTTIGTPDNDGDNTLRISGDGTGSTAGGLLQIMPAADHDGTIDAWNFLAHEDDLRIGPDSGASALTIENTGQVGIGQDAPLADLHVQTSTGASVYITGDGDTDNPSISLFEDATLAAESGFEMKFDGTNNELEINSLTGGTPVNRMTIERNNGFIGINTEVPERHLHIEKPAPGSATVVEYIDLSSDESSTGIAGDGIGIRFAHRNVATTFFQSRIHSEIDGDNNGADLVFSPSPNSSVPVENLRLTGEGDAEFTSSTATEVSITGAAAAEQVNASVVLNATAGTDQRATGIFMHDAGSDTEWFFGRPFSAGGDNDRIVFARQTGVGAHAQSTSAETNAIMSIRADGDIAFGTGDGAEKFVVQDGTTAQKVSIDGWGGGSDIDTILPGSTTGPVIKGGDNSHLVFSLNDNDVSDGFHFVSTGGDADNVMDTYLMGVYGDQQFTFGTNAIPDNLMFNVQETATDTSGTSYTTRNYVIANPGGASTATIYANQNYATTNGGSGNGISELGGAHNFAEHADTAGTIADLRGAYNRSNINNAGVATNAYGSLDQVTYTGSGGGALFVGSQGWVNATGTGTIGEGRGLYGLTQTGAGQTMTTGTGVYALTSHGASTVMATAYGLIADINDTGAGSITTGYGVYISDIDATTDYGLFQSAADDDNYFAGDLAIGETNDPTHPLHIHSTQTIGAIGSLNTANAIVRIQEDAGATILSLDGNTVTSTNSMIVGTTGSNVLDLITNDTKRITITGGGNIGIEGDNPQGALQVGSVTSGTGEATHKGKIIIQQGGGLAQDHGLEFKTSSSGNGYGWRISNPDLGAGDIPLVFERRSNAAAWTEIARFDVNTHLVLEDQIQIKGGVPGLGKVLTSDANGLATWETPSTNIKGVIDDDLNTQIQTDEGLADENRIRFDTAGNEVMVVDSDGDVGIGDYGVGVGVTEDFEITRSTANVTAELNSTLGGGTATLSMDTTGDGSSSIINFEKADTVEGSFTYAHAAANGSEEVTINVGSSNVFTIEGSGEVGINQVNPTADLHVLSTGGGGVQIEDTTEPYLHIRRNGTNEWFFAADQTNNSLEFRPGGVGNAPSVTFETGGDVAIGTNDATERLTIVGAGDGIGIKPGSGNDYIEFVSDLDDNLAFSLTDHTNRDMHVKRYNASGTFQDIIMAYENSSGFIGIGANLTNPTERLHVEGCIRHNNGTLGASCASDRRLKDNIEDVDFDGRELEIFLGLRPRTYFYRSDYKNTSYGFIAQEVELVDPSLMGETREGGIKTLNYERIKFLHFKASQKMAEKIVEQEREIASLKEENEDLKSRLERIEAALGIQD